MFYPRIAMILFSLMASLSLLTGAQPAQGEKLKAAFLYLGPIGDQGWTRAHDEGRLDLENTFGIETMFVENVVVEDAERVITTLATRGYSPIFTTSFGYMGPTLAAAKKFPNTIFMHCSGYKRAPNVGTYMARLYQSRYLTGLVAGAMTKSNIIGYVNAYPIPECVRLLNAFTIGVRQSKPNAVVRNIWINSFTDAERGKQAAKTLLAAGADVITQGIDLPTPQEAVVEAGPGHYFVGWDSDMSKLAPEVTLTSALIRWKYIYRDVVQRIVAGTWKPDDYYWGMDQGVVDIAPLGPMVPDFVKTMVEKRRNQIVAGEYEVFAGPIRHQDGKVWIPEGKVATDQEILTSVKFVEGVVGSAQ